MHYLVTGHTGFKGAWLTFLLNHRGHTVSGVALDPPDDSLFLRGNLTKFLEHDIRCDIRDFDKLSSAFSRINPDVVIHMAAQSLVRESYKNPVSTFEINVNGTLNVLRATQTLEGVRAQVVVTTDKVYRNVGQQTGYIESDALGGHDPYSASKAMADIATQSWVSSFENAPTAIARAGNVIGGGDVAADRLIPELVSAYISGTIPQLRYPNAVRPWQHVLDCVSGYLSLVDALLLGKGQGEWNFGPMDTDVRTVADVANEVGQIWNVEKKWSSDRSIHPHEAGLLLLNSAKARTELNWRDRLDFAETVAWTANWYQNVSKGASEEEETLSNVVQFESLG